MHGALVLALALSVAGPGRDTQMWGLDAPGAFTVSKPGVDEHGEAVMETTVKSVPAPFSFSAARIVREDETEVTVADGLRDVGRSQDLDIALDAVKAEWWRVATFVSIPAMAGAVVALVGLAIVVPAAFFTASQFLVSPSGNPTTWGAQSWAWLAVGPAIMGAGMLLLVPGAVAGLMALHKVVNALKNAVTATPESVGAGTAWPSDLGAHVVQDHNQALHTAPPPAQATPNPEEGLPPAAPPEPDAPTVIPS